MEIHLSTKIEATADLAELRDEKLAPEFNKSVIKSKSVLSRVQAINLFPITKLYSLPKISLL